jgi:hypothetical protein
MWGSRGAEAAGKDELQGQPLAHVGADAPSAPSQHAEGGFSTSPAVTRVADPETFRPTPPPPRGEIIDPPSVHTGIHRRVPVMKTNARCVLPSSSRRAIPPSGRKCFLPFLNFGLLAATWYLS